MFCSKFLEDLSKNNKIKIITKRNNDTEKDNIQWTAVGH